jgi:DEAD/DEAH box helicase domain-containing protein
LERSSRLPLYSHQAEAIDEALKGQNVVQATAAGSGKSIGLLMPVLDACLRDDASTAIVIYPLRALANDQLNSLNRLGTAGTTWVDECTLDLVLAPGIEAIRVARYDGSVLEHQKKAARASARILITTPDSIHQSLLRMATRIYADRTSWSRILRGLRLVVLDEIHSYQGVFGSAVAQVLRRLRRAAEWYGAEPQFLAASATIGNPVEVAERLTGTGPWVLVDRDGSPRRGRTVLICNPPALSDAAAKKEATLSKAPSPETVGRVAPQTMAIELMAGGSLASEHHAPVRTICFTRSRLEVFSLTKRLQGRLKDLHAQPLADSIAPYTATLLDSDRLEAEGKLRDGSTLAVVSTSALELGIDVPDLSIAVLVGFPGQISSFRQRAGRVGRAGEGLVVLIVGDDPLQQFIASDPNALQSLLEGRPEEVVLNPDAREIVRRFGLAPAQEDLGGVAFEDSKWFGGHAEEWLSSAEGPPATTHSGINYWKLSLEDDPYPPLRSSTGGQSYSVVAGPDRKPVGVIDAATAPRDAFVPAIWNGPQHSYRVVGLDHKMRQIICEGPLESQHLTRGVTVDQVDVRSALASPRPLGTTAQAGYGVLGINRQVFSYKIMNLAGGERTESVEPPRWPPIEFVTEGMHLHLELSWLTGGPWAPNDAVKGLEHVLLSLAPVVVACDPYDIDATSDSTTVFLYDSFGGGIGVTRVAFERLEEIVGYGVRLVEACPCQQGCPSCVYLSRRPDGNRDVSKAGALHLLSCLAAELHPAV